jgi:hypothetical protein
MTTTLTTPKLGERMPDGTDYVGLSDTGKPIYARLGEQMPDGSIYVGNSSIDDRPIFARLSDQEPDRTINASRARAAMGALGTPEELSSTARLFHKMYLDSKANQTQSIGQVGGAEKLIAQALAPRVPTAAELNELFKDRKVHHEVWRLPMAREFNGWGPRSPTPNLGGIRGWPMPTVGEIRAWFNSRTAMKRTGAVPVRQETDADQQKPQMPTTPKP